MTDRIELNEEMLDEVTGGVRGDCRDKNHSKIEESILKNAEKKIVETAKVGKALKHMGGKKVAHR